LVLLSTAGLFGGSSLVRGFPATAGFVRWALGEWWGRRVARAWTKAVEGSLDQIASEAERGGS
jgi:hypothetical protein